MRISFVHVRPTSNDSKSTRFLDNDIYGYLPIAEILKTLFGSYVDLNIELATKTVAS